jgi:hypothetical protein
MSGRGGWKKALQCQFSNHFKKVSKNKHNSCPTPHCQPQPDNAGSKRLYKMIVLNKHFYTWYKTFPTSWVLEVHVFDV